MSISLGIVMDPIDSIKPQKDSSFALLLEAQKRDWQTHYMEVPDLYLRDGVTYARMRTVAVFDDTRRWFELGDATKMPLASLDVLLMRKDPPFDMEYIYTTYLLEQAMEQGLLIVNRPDSLRDCNEKLFTAWFPECCPPTLVTRNCTRIDAFLEEQRDIILKPLGGMGGASVFRVSTKDPNRTVIMETLTDHGRRFAMAQRFIPEIAQGDKRILMIAGKPVPHALARIPAPGETRGNLAAGGQGVGVDLSDRDLWICEQIGSALKQRGLLFAGLDIIGNWLTEINVTSPTCIRELDQLYGLNIAAQILDELAARI